MELLGDGVLNEPAVELNLRVLDVGAVLVLEGQLLSVVLAEDGVAVELVVPRNGHVYDLLLTADVGQQQSRSQYFSANELTVVDDVGVDVEDVVYVYHVLLLLSLGLNLFLVLMSCLQQTLWNLLFLGCLHILLSWVTQTCIAFHQGFLWTLAVSRLDILLDFLAVLLIL